MMKTPSVQIDDYREVPQVMKTPSVQIDDYEASRYTLAACVEHSETKDPLR